jgi:hypothetical protein
MAARQIKATRKNSDGDITMVCNAGELWSPKLVADVINDIENNYQSYYVMVQGKYVDVHVVNDAIKGKYLRTDPDKTKVNNLDYLPEC